MKLTICFSQIFFAFGFISDSVEAFEAAKAELLLITFPRSHERGPVEVT